jgi:hypothetical protein
MIRRVRFPTFPIAAANGQPAAGASVGILLVANFGFTPLTDVDCLIRIRLIGPALATLSATAFLWGQRLSTWGVMGNDSGQLNGTNPISGIADAAGNFVFQVPLVNLSFVERVYLQMTTFVATTGVDADLFIGRNPPPPT